MPIITVEAHEKYIATMLKNPRAKPIFEEYYSVLGRYPPYLEGASWDEIEEETIEAIKGMLEFAKKDMDK